MRNILEPPPVALCKRCDVALTLKAVDRTDAPLGRIRNVFVCVKCGNERAFAAPVDLYAAVSAQPTARLSA